MNHLVDDVVQATSEFQIVTVHPDLLLYVDHLQKKNAEALSFYPKCVFEREAERGRIFLGLLNGSPCGYLYVGAKTQDVKCHQVCIEYDARRRLHGASLVQAMEDYAKDAHTITLRCGFDLDANTFWQELGYNCVQVQQGGVRRMRQINVWRKVIRSGLFEQAFVEPAVGKVDASIWRKYKQTGVTNQFARGSQLNAYRESILNDAKKAKDCR